MSVRDIARDYRAEVMEMASRIAGGIIAAGGGWHDVGGGWPPFAVDSEHVANVAVATAIAIVVRLDEIATPALPAPNQSQLVLDRDRFIGADPPGGK